MKSFTFIFTLLYFQFNLSAQNTIITGNLKGLKADQVKLMYLLGTDRKVDSIKVVNEKFSWKGTLAEPKHMYLMVPKGSYAFYAQSGKITITGNADSAESIKVAGSKIQDESTAFEKSIEDLTSQEIPLYQQYGHVSKKAQTALETKLSEIREEKRRRAYQYIAVHPSSFYSIDLIWERATYGSEYEAVKKLYDLLDDKAKQTVSGKAVGDRLNVLKRSALGAPMIDFSQNDTAGSAVHFSDFKGKYVLVDFWASWCGPCRAENPNVLNAYNEYKDKNFTVIGISLDDKSDNWKKAIRDDNMPWTQLSDLKGWGNEVSAYYGIVGIPSNLLIDPSGKIVAKDLRGEELLKKLTELMN
jgi:peroxiredoxin